MCFITSVLFVLFAQTADAQFGGYYAPSWLGNYFGPPQIPGSPIIFPVNGGPPQFVEPPPPAAAETTTPAPETTTAAAETTTVAP